MIMIMLEVVTIIVSNYYGINLIMKFFLYVYSLIFYVFFYFSIYLHLYSYSYLFVYLYSYLILYSIITSIPFVNCINSNYLKFTMH